MIVSGVALLAARPEVTLIRAGAPVWFAGEPLPASLFLIERRGEAAIGFRIDTDAIPGWLLGQELALAVGRLMATAEVTEVNGLAVVDCVVLSVGHGERAAWIEGVDDEQSPEEH
jgi:hypothetical protein